MPIVAEGNKKTNGQIPPKLFYVAFKVNGKTYHLETPITAPNQESVASVLTAIVTANMPQVAGFELYAHDTEYEQNRRFLMLCPVMEIMTSLQPLLQKMVGQQVMKAAIPVMGAKENGENLQKMFDELKKAGKQV